MGGPHQGQRWAWTGTLYQAGLSTPPLCTTGQSPAATNPPRRTARWVDEDRDSEPATVTVRDGWDRVYKTVITQSRGNRMMTMTLWCFAQEWLYAASAFTV